jgi:hypothetical protein
VDGTTALEQILSRWITASGQLTVGDIGAYGGSPVILVKLGSNEFALNRDTTRAAVRDFLAAAARAGGAANLPWRVTTNARGRFNRVTYRPDDEPTPGWYAYLHRSSDGPRELR